MAEHWQRIIDRLEKDEARANDPVARLLMAHACLATDRNNAAMALFLSMKETRDLQAWAAWTEALLRRSPQHPVALYLAADAKARTGSLKEAMDTLTQAIQHTPGFVLALNARGVLRVLTNDWVGALRDLYQATQLAPNFADAQANLGTYWILRGHQTER